ncbi:MAG: hypothetical protein Q8L88_00705 [Bacteroidota bacterium]|nr:hypothetical protein [Bacteroidota bacterium]
MKKSTKFFILAIVVNVILSAIATFTTMLKTARVVDLVTFYATAFGAGASFASIIISLRGEKKKGEESVAKT